MIWLTSDWHAGHEKILTLGKGRPFATGDAMNAAIIDRLNAVVQPGDTLYHLGDFCCGVGQDKAGYARELRKAIRCSNIILLRGNHDPKKKNSQEFDRVFEEVHEMLETTLHGRRIVMCHYPLEHWGYESTGVWHLHGHIHSAVGQRHLSRLRLDVGVDGHHFTPWSFAEAEAEMLKNPWEKVSHHGA